MTCDVWQVVCWLWSQCSGVWGTEEPDCVDGCEMWELMDLQWFPVGWRWTRTGLVPDISLLTAQCQYQPVSPQWNLEWDCQWSCQLLFSSWLPRSHNVWEYNKHSPDVWIFPDFLTLKNWRRQWRKDRDTSPSPVTQPAWRNRESVNISLTFLTSCSSFNNNYSRFVSSGRYFYQVDLYRNKTWL